MKTQNSHSSQKLKKLGLIGGTGPESTIMYYRQLAYGVKDRLDAECFPPLVIESLSVFEVLRFCEQRDYAGLAEYILRGVGVLAAAGAEFATLTGITPHIVFDEVASKAPIPLVSIIGAACAHAKSQGFERLALLATLPTMRGEFFQKPFKREGIEVLLPSTAEQDFIGGKIKSEIEHGTIKPATKAAFVQIARRLVLQEGAQAVVLGCTELPLLFGAAQNLGEFDENGSDLKNEVKGSVNAPLIDVVRVHINELINMITA